MDDLLRRIEAARPDPIRVNDDELAKLRAYVRVTRVRGSPSRLQHDPRYREEHEARCDALSHVRMVLLYNDELRKAASSPQSPAPTPGRRGRKLQYDTKQDARIAQAKQSGRHKDDAALAREFGIKVKDVKRALDRHRKR